MQSSRRKKGFTLVEAVVAITVTAIAGSAILLGMSNSMQITNEVVEQSIGMGIGQQLMDEISGVRYNVSPTNDSPPPIMPDRFWCDNLEDYDGIVMQPPTDVRGVPLGMEGPNGTLRHPSFCLPIGYLDAWCVEISVFHVDESDPSLELPDGETSNCRCVEVRVSRVESEGQYRQIVQLRRVFAYVPPM